MTLSEIFADTQRLYKTNARLVSACEYSREHHAIFPADEKIDCERNRFEDDAKIIVSKKRTFEAAQTYAREGKKAAVLNFANSFVPGGGVVHGARAQEECLCRISTLYDSLSSPEMVERFYTPHCKSGDDLANDDVIYTPRVLVFKSDTVEPKLVPESEWFFADVLTCAAPCIGRGANSVADEMLLKMHESRGKHILDAACKNEAEVLILGAFGCGAFSNPPEVVAEAYRQLLPDYRHAFRTIEFAVFCRDFETKNYEVFNKVLGACAE